MDSWKDSARRRKDYRRGGTEPVPEITRKHRGRVAKIYRLEVFRGPRYLHPEENPTWRKEKNYEKFEGAVDALNAIGLKRHTPWGWSRLYCHPYRIVNTQTGEVLIERDYTKPKEEVES